MGFWFDLVKQDVLCGKGYLDLLYRILKTLVTLLLGPKLMVVGKGFQFLDELYKASFVLEN